MNKLNLSEIVSGLVLSEAEIMVMLAELDALAKTQEQRNTVDYLQKGWNFVMSQPILDAGEPRPKDDLVKLIENCRCVYAVAEGDDSRVMARDDYRIMADALEHLRAENARLQAELNMLMPRYEQRKLRYERAEAAAASARVDEEQAIARADRAEAERDLLLDEIEALNLPVPFGPQNGKAWHEAVQESLDALRADVERSKASDAAWRILCGGKQKIIDALEADALRVAGERMGDDAYIETLTQDAERYRFMRSPLAGEHGIVQGEFWEELSFKLCREEKMDELVDGAMKLLKRRIDAARKENPTTAADYPHGWHESAADNASKP